MIVVNDLDRSRMGYIAVVIGTRLLTFSDVVHTDDAGSAEHAEPRAVGVVERDVATCFIQCRAEIEAGIVRYQRAGHHARRRFALPMHDHAAGGAHNIGRRLAKDVPASSSNLGNVLVGVHFREQDQTCGIAGFDGDALGIEERSTGLPCLDLLLLLLPGEQPSRDGDRKFVDRQPAKTVHRRLPCPCATLGLVHLPTMMIEADAQGKL